MMENKVCMITGANSGIGKETAASLARMGATVVMVCRSRERGQAALEEISSGSGRRDIELMTADLSSQDSVRAMAAAYQATHDRLDVLINNAGVICAAPEIAADGIDRTAAVNYLGPFLLTRLLLDVLKASAPSRIINVSSEAHRRCVDPAALLMEGRFRPRRYWIESYSASKLANLMFTYELARRLEGSGVCVNALHPGWARSRMGRTEDSWWVRTFCALSNLWSKGCGSAAGTSVFLASSPEVERVTGKYFVDSREARSSRLSYDRTLQRDLWDRSEKLLHLGAAIVPL